MRVIGIDPGLRRTGWGVVDVLGTRLSHVANGTCQSEGTELATRLRSLYDQLTRVLAQWSPETAAVEQTFVNKDAAGTLKLGQARGIALLVPALFGIPVAEYAPNAVKKVVVGVGHAQKSQVEHMVRLQLPTAIIGGPDAADALAIALCHAHHARFADRLGAALARAGCRMIGKITGYLDYRAADHVLVDTGGVGYILACSDRTLAALPAPGGVVSLYTELVVREDMLQLIGFSTLAEREWYRLLTSVQGVGSKAALALLGALGPEGLARALMLGDATTIRVAPGVGPKIAQRIVLELKTKAPTIMAMGAEGARSSLAAVPSGVPVVETAFAPHEPPRLVVAASGPAPVPAAMTEAHAQADALSALVNLGYAPVEAAAAVSEAAAGGDLDGPGLIRAALRLLAPKG